MNGPDPNRLLAAPEQSVQRLFRTEVIADAQTRAIGTVRLARPWSFTVMTVIATVLLTVFALFCYFGEYTRRARLEGVVAARAGTVTIFAPQSGWVAAVHVRAGQAIAEGQPLVALRAIRSSLPGSDTDAGEVIKEQIQARLSMLRQSEQIKIEQARAQEQLLHIRSRKLAVQIAASERTQKLMAERLQILARALTQAEELHTKGFLSAAQVDVRRDELLDIRSDSETNDRDLELNRIERLNVEAELQMARTRLRAELTELGMSRSLVDQQLVENRSQAQAILRATSAGTLSALNIKAGQTVTPGMAIAAIVPAARKGQTQFEVHLYAQSDSVGLLQAGQKVTMRLPAFPYVKYGTLQGRVADITRSPVNGEAGTSLDGRSGTYFRVIVALDKERLRSKNGWFELRPGFAVEADIALERKRIWEYIADPLVSAAKMVQN